MVACSDLRPWQRQWAAKSAARRAEHMRAQRRKLRASNQLHAQATGIARPPPPSRLDSGVRSTGDDLLFRGRPPGRPLLLVSGDVNQGREMQVLARELDAFDPSVVPVERVGDDA